MWGDRRYRPYSSGVGQTSGVGVRRVAPMLGYCPLSRDVRHREELGHRRGHFTYVLDGKSQDLVDSRLV
jgi:hypothetical protein